MHPQVCRPPLRSFLPLSSPQLWLQQPHPAAACCCQQPRRSVGRAGGSTFAAPVPSVPASKTDQRGASGTASTHRPGTCGRRALAGLLVTAAEGWRGVSAQAWDRWAMQRLLCMPPCIAAAPAGSEGVGVSQSLCGLCSALQLQAAVGCTGVGCTWGAAHSVSWAGQAAGLRCC